MPTSTPLEVTERIADVIESLIPDRDFIPAEVAEKVLIQLEESEPTLLHDWLYFEARKQLTYLLSNRLRSQRARSQNRARARAFGRAVDEANDGDEVALHAFVQMYAVNDENVRKPVAQMTGADHQYVAQRYQKRGTAELMMAAFHRQIAKIVGKKTTAETMTEAKYIELYQSVLKKGAGQ